MNRIVSILFVCLMQASLAVASTYNLRVEVTPDGAGTLNTSSGVYEEGASVYLRTYKNTGFVFKGWFDGDSLLSSATSFYYTMPARDAAVQARYEYDPTVPDNPAMPDTATYYSFTASVSPDGAGTLNISSGKYAQGADVYVRTYANTGFQFVGWEDENGEILSTNTSYHYSMPGKNAHLTAVYNYDPTVPANPDSMGVQRKITVEGRPVSGGKFNVNNTVGAAGSTISLRATTNTGYKFLHWESEEGDTLSVEREFNYLIPNRDSKVYGVFEYDPSVPSNPAKNHWNKTTGELIVDDYTPGSLSSAMKDVIGGDNFADVNTFIVKGRLESGDYNSLSNLKYATTIDLSRTGGTTTIPNRAFQNLSASSILLSSEITDIGDYVFRYCANLASLTLYAQVPPVCSTNTFTNFTNKANCTIYVPSSAIELYASADYWKDFTIRPISADAHVLQVNLPSDASDGRYKHNSLEIVNVKTGVRQKYVISDRLFYTFNALRKDEQYNVYMYSQTGLEIGRIEHVVIPDQDIEVAFDKIKTLHTVSAKVLTEDGTDVTSQVDVEWLRPLDDGSVAYLRKAKSLGEIPEGQQLLCRISLDNTLGVSYLNPDDVEFVVSDEQRICKITLVPFRTIALTGRIVDENGSAMADASVSVSQILNGKYNKTFVAKPDRKGFWTMSVFDAPDTHLTYSASECVNVNDTISVFDTNVSNLDLGKTTMKSIVGARVTYSFTYHAAGVEEIDDFYSDYQNVIISVFNVTQNRTHKEVALQYPVLAILDEKINSGDVIKLTATSKKGNFNPIEETVTIGENKSAEVTFDIVGKGGILASFEMTDNPIVIGLLYSSKGELLKKKTYSEAQVKFVELEDGEYTLITMGQSDLMNSVLRLANFAEIGLTEGKEYVKNSVKVENGKLTEIKNPVIPAFDESLFYYTNSSTSFSANKSSVTTGNYLTLRSSVDFKTVYKNGVSNVTLVVDLPEACDFVEQSVIQGPNLLPYTLNDKRLTIQLGDDYKSQVRFCVVPTTGGAFNATASVVFDYNGKTVTQPIGAATSDIKYLEFKTLSTIAKPEFNAQGYAPAKSEVTVYDTDNNILGKCKTDNTGYWITPCTLVNPYHLKTCDVYAVVKTQEGAILQSECRRITLDKNAIYPLNVKCISDDITEGEVIFDFVDSQTKTLYYTIIASDGGNVTFVINMSDNSPEKISNMILYVHQHDGHILKLYPQYDSEKDYWYANYEINMDNVPVNVSLDYEYPNNNMCDSMTYVNSLIKGYPTFSLKGTEKEEQVCSYTIIPRETTLGIHCVSLRIGINEKSSVEKRILQSQFEEQKMISSNSCRFFTTKNNAFQLLKETKDSLFLFATFVYEDSISFTEYKNILASKMKEYSVNRTKPMRAFSFDPGSDHISPSTDRLNQWRDMIIQDAIDEANRKLKCADDVTNIRLHEAVMRLRQCVGFSLGSFLAHTINLTTTAAGRPEHEIEYLLQTIDTYDSASSFGSEMQNISKAGQEWLRVIRDAPNCENGSVPNGSNNNNKNQYGEDYGDYVSNTSDVQVHIDPAGFVYEAVPDNRVEGVQATIYYKETKEDMYGDLYDEVIRWNAEEYAQKNPLFTDENGMYRWDVPKGLWQVKFEKDGYQTAYSEWLPVPPPQLEVNVGIVQRKQPEVSEARAYEDGVDVQFDKYMDLSTLTTDNIYVTANGEILNGEIRFMDSALADEHASEDDSTATRYASRVRFVPETSLSVTTGEIRLTVNRNVLSYAGIPMTEAFSQVLDVEKEVKSITAEDIKVLYGGDTELTIYAVPFDAAVGRTLRIENSSSLIASVEVSEVVLDEEGKAVVTVKGELPGSATLTFAIDDVAVTGTCKVDVVIEIISDVEVPKSSHASGTSVYRGTGIRLLTDIEDAVIYFTTDGSCPCDENGTRRKYTVPIIINEDTKILAMTSVGTNSELASETVEFNYKLKQSDMEFQMAEGWTWISHNFDNAISPSALTSDDNVSRILSQTEEVIRDSQLGMVGALTELSAAQSYKVESKAATTRLRLSDIAWNPANPISLNTGWNWLGYPISQTMSLNEAFANAEPNEGDYIVGQDGFAQYADNTWVGTLMTLVPGKGYLYHSQSKNSFAYNANIVSKSKALYGKGLPNQTPWTPDIHKYPNIMCLVAQVYENGSVSDGYSIGAFCGTECRGVGKYVDGMLMMNIYGEGNEKIVFRAVHNETQESFDITEEIPFKEILIGSLSQPYALHIGEATGVTEIQTGWKVWVNGNDLYVTLNGKQFDSVTLTDVYGTVYLSMKTVLENVPVNLSELPAGVYIVTAVQGRDVYYKKILKK